MYNVTAQYGAYNMASQTLPKTRQIVMLYDGIIRNVQQAGEAVARQDVEARFNCLCKASEIISGLQNSLDFDNGGDIAKVLYDYYASIDYRMMTVHRTGNAALLEQITRELKKMRDAWAQIDTEEARKAAETAAPMVAPARPEPRPQEYVDIQGAVAMSA